MRKLLTLSAAIIILAAFNLSVSIQAQTIDTGKRPSTLNKEMEDFKEYTEKYSDMPYAEYQKMKRTKKGDDK